MRHRIPMIVTMLFIAASLAAPQGAVAADGGYTVNVRTSEWPGFSDLKDGTNFRSGDMLVSTVAGRFTAGSYRRWKLHVPDASVRIAGGRIIGTMATPDTGFYATIRQGTDGGAIQSVMNDGSGTTTFNRALAGDASWIDFGLTTPSGANPARDFANRMAVNSLSLNLRDLTIPGVRLSMEPDGGTWHGSACVPIQVVASDDGSGVWRVDVANPAVADYAPIAWRGSVQPGLRPGTASVVRNACIDGSRQQHGLNTFTMTARDFSGLEQAQTFRLRFDLEAPTVETEMVNGTAFTAPRPAPVFAVRDADAGLDAVTMTIDGAAVPVTSDAYRYSPALTRNLPVGEYTLVVTSVDRAANRTVIERTFTVGDVTAPVLTLTSPEAIGGFEPMLTANAVDEASDVNAESWSVNVNGIAMPVVAAGANLSTSIGMLTAGDHAIVVSVADAQGNIATKTISYRAEGLAQGVTGPVVGPQSGVFASATTSATWRYGQTVSLSALAARHGRPLAGYRIRAIKSGSVLGSELADAHGLATVRFVAKSPGTVSLDVQGVAVPALAVPLRVAPGLSISAASRRPRRNQRVKVSGRVRPALPGRKVIFEGRVGRGSWFSLRRTAKIGSDGRFSTYVTSSVAGRVSVRVRYAAAGGWSAGTSNVIALRVRH